MLNLPSEIKSIGGNAHHTDMDAAPWNAVLVEMASAAEASDASERLLRLQNLYRLMADAIPHLIWASQSDGAIDYFNARSMEYTGATPEALYAQGWQRVIHPEDYPLLFHSYHEGIRRGEEFRCELRIRRADGQYRWHQAHAVPLHDAQGGILRWYGTCTDVDALKQTENALRNREARLQASEERQRLIFEEAAVGMALVDMDGILQKPNRAFCALLGYGEAEMTGQSFRNFTVEEDIAPTEAVAARLIRGECEAVNWEKRYQHKNGAIIYALVKISLLRDADGEPQYYNTQIIDITERKRAEQQSIAANAWLAAANRKLEQQKTALEAANAKLESLATMDGLTEIKNHRAFQERLRSDVERSARYGEELSLLLLDVDNFKQYNDAYGHPAGDRVLKTVALLMQQGARGSDFTARYGGEEFVVVLPETGRYGAVEAAERLRAAIQTYAWPHCSVTVSVGVATLRPGEDATQTLIDRADKAMYEAKQQGRNRLAHADDIGEKTLPHAETHSLNEALKQILTIQSDAFASASQEVRGTVLGAYDATVDSWCRILDMKDKETEGHSERVTGWMVRLARFVGLTEEEILFARWGALLHDIGKVGVPDAILLKPGPLDAKEWQAMRRHPVLAHNMLKEVSFLRPALDIPYAHHEKWDGSGYPRGLKGEDIPFAARLFAVIDVYDALKSDRPYRKGWTERRVRDYLRAQSGAHFDPKAVKAFLKLLRQTGKKVKTRG